jgi:hypothetical protein
MAHTPASDTATLATLNESRSRVDIRRAEAEFTRLQRQFTIHDDSGRAQSSTPQPKHLRKDLENAPSEDGDEEPFDLREYLTSSNDASQAAGIKHKHVGVTWEDLQVTGIGGEDNKVEFPFRAGLVFPTPDVPVRSLPPRSSVRLWARSCSLSCSYGVWSRLCSPPSIPLRPRLVRSSTSECDP